MHPDRGSSGLAPWLGHRALYNMVRLGWVKVRSIRDLGDILSRGRVVRGAVVRGRIDVVSYSDHASSNIP